MPVGPSQINYNKISQLNLTQINKPNNIFHTKNLPHSLHKPLHIGLTQIINNNYTQHSIQKLQPHGSKRLLASIAPVLYANQVTQVHFIHSNN